MKAKPIVPAPLQRDANGVPYSAAYDDVYHPRVGALTQARHVFIGGTGLPARWRGARARSKATHEVEPGRACAAAA